MYPPDVVSEYLELFLLSEGGPRRLNDLAFDVDHDRFTRPTDEVLERAFGEAVRVWLTRDDPHPAWAAEAFDKALEQVDNDASDPFHFARLGHPHPLSDGVARVSSGDDVNKHLIRFSAGKGRGRDRHDLTDLIARRYLRTGGRVAAGDLREEAELTAPRPVVFATHKGEVAAASSSARAVCGRLGLAHFQPGWMAIAIEYPAGEVDEGDTHQPTSLDGGLAGCLCVEGDEECTHALHVPTCTHGGVEFVHAPIPFTERFRWRPIGILHENLLRLDGDFPRAYRSTWTTHHTDRVVALLAP
ncbi:MAG: hypothetical protein AAGK21_00035 [Bacteroidota bacterium]